MNSSNVNKGVKVNSLLEDFNIGDIWDGRRLPPEIADS
jgi:hypothetical protein